MNRKHFWKSSWAITLLFACTLAYRYSVLSAICFAFLTILTGGNIFTAALLTCCAWIMFARPIHWYLKKYRYFEENGKEWSPKNRMT